VVEMDRIVDRDPQHHAGDHHRGQVRASSPDRQTAARSRRRPPSRRVADPFPAATG
jgi:hypothetical protein